MHSTLKYLNRHAEQEAGAAPFPSKTYGHVIVIPAYGEDDSLMETFDSIHSGPLGETLKIVVVNARADSPAEIRERNRRHLTLLSHEKDLILIDRNSEEKSLPAGQGVGLARKIGCDVALRLIWGGAVRSPWIHCTDGDTLLPGDYFHRTVGLDSTGNIAALIYPFHHLCEEDAATAEAMRLYEISLRYYVLGLSHSASPYAYPSLGSSLAVHAKIYARIGGFPRRNAGEDFYLLNKAAKNGAIVLLPGSPLLIRGRLSDRVPFGTGKALHRRLEEAKAGLPFKLYDPHLFSYLRVWLNTLQRWALDPKASDPHTLLKESCREFPGLNSDLLERVLKEMGVFRSFEKVPAAHRPEIRLRHAHTWWDAFRTLKFIHALRGSGYPSLPFHEALSRADFLKVSPYLAQDDWEGLRVHLSRAEEKALERPRGLLQ